MPANTLLTAIRAHLELEPTHSVVIEPITKGASGRTIIRLKPEGFPTYIGIHYTMERADNANYLPVAEFLTNNKFNVPHVLYDNTARCCALVEDLGDQDLLSMKDEPWGKREPVYRSALKQLDKLFYTRPPKDLEFQPPFDAGMYAWEQEYFFDNLAESYLGMASAETQPLRNHSALKKMSEALGASSLHLVHRDFQSQNIIVKDAKAFLIDFQGMRRGRQEYDLASLIYDPYMNHSAEEREKLLNLWEDISEERPLNDIFKMCAIQRLMQALGAYGNLVANKNEEWFEQHIPIAANLLRGLVTETDYEEAILPVLDHLDSK
jgi:N-acetylmuramate 1-kinase